MGIGGGCEAVCEDTGRGRRPEALVFFLSLGGTGGNETDRGGWEGTGVTWHVSSGGLEGNLKESQLRNSGAPPAFQKRCQ